jgi:protein involved in polysaccharide export with SLBB domain
MADWQKELTLGPGDVLDIEIYQQPESRREALSIGPDGRLNYLQASDVTLAGLTVDAARARLTTVLTNFYQPPFRVMIFPKRYNSKKYYVLGNVRRQGVYPLERPLTVAEAVAYAGGFASQVSAADTFLLADLSRSFLVRRDASNGFSRVQLDFENLFLRGDLSQNAGMAPDDYLYFPPLDLQEIYLLGDVPSPGVAVYTPDATVLRAIVGQGGFSPTAYRARVLVVRGSINQPQRFVVNVTDIIYARAPDFKLEPRDIVYVSRKPWAKAEELMELAVNDFLRAAVAGWVGQNVGPWINDPIVK